MTTTSTSITRSDGSSQGDQLATNVTAARLALSTITSNSWSNLDRNLFPTYSLEGYSISVSVPDYGSYTIESTEQREYTFSQAMKEMITLMRTTREKTEREAKHVFK